MSIHANRCFHQVTFREDLIPEGADTFVDTGRLMGSNRLAATSPSRRLHGQVKLPRSGLRDNHWEGGLADRLLPRITYDVGISRRLTPTESNSNRQNALRFNGPGEYPSLGLSFLSSVSFPHVQYMPT